jgi:hypothetical protein
MHYFWEVFRGLALAACFFGCLYFWFLSAFGTYRAAKLRKPGRSFLSSMNLLSVFFSRDRYLEEADPARWQSFLGCLGFVVCWLIAFTVGMLSSGK